MSQSARVSVIIIFLNAGRFIEEAIASVFAQTYGHWELLLVDDGSTDGSTAIAQRHAAQYPDRVRYLEHAGHQNRGMSAARNLGLHQATGDYVAFLDADDVWLPRKLEAQVALLNAQPAAGMVYGPTQWWYSWTGRPEDAPRDFVHALGVPPNTLLAPPDLLARFVRQEGISPCTCSMLVRRELVQRIGGFEEAFRGLYEDQVFCAKLCLAAPVFASEACWYRYRQHPASACAVAARGGHHAAARLLFLQWLARYLAEQGVQDRRVWGALRQALQPYRFPTLYRLLGQAQSLIQALSRSTRRTPGRSEV